MVATSPPRNRESGHRSSRSSAETRARGKVAGARTHVGRVKSALEQLHIIEAPTPETQEELAFLRRPNSAGHDRRKAHGMSSTQRSRRKHHKRPATAHGKGSPSHRSDAKDAPHSHSMAMFHSQSSDIISTLLQDPRTFHGLSAMKPGPDASVCGYWLEDETAGTGPQNSFSTPEASARQHVIVDGNGEQSTPNAFSEAWPEQLPTSSFDPSPVSQRPAPQNKSQLKPLRVRQSKFKTLEPWDSRERMVRARREAFEDAREDMILQKIEYKSNIKQRFEEKHRVKVMSQILLEMVHVGIAARQLCAMHEVNMRNEAARILKNRRLLAVKLIENWYSNIKIMIHIRRSQRYLKVLRSFVGKWARYHMYRKRRDAANLVISFLTACEREGRIKYALKRFWRCIYLLQRSVVSFIACRKARVLMAGIALQRAEVARMKEHRQAAASGTDQISLLTRQFVHKSKRLRKLLNLSTEMNFSLQHGRCLVPVHDHKGRPVREKILEKIIAEQRRRHVKDEDAGFRRAEQQISRFDLSDARQMLQQTLKDNDARFQGKLLTGRKHSPFLLLTRGGLEQIENEIDAYMLRHAQYQLEKGR